MKLFTHETQTPEYCSGECNSH